MKRLMFLSLMLIASTAFGQTYEQRLGSAPVSVFSPAKVNELPVLLWGADGVSFFGNGGTVKTQPGSIFKTAGLEFTIVNGDDFNGQVKAYLAGRPWLRGTARMVGAASEVLNKDPRTKPVMVLQLSYSVGDHVVATSGIKTISDLKGKRIAVQLPIGPHLDLIDDTLRAAKLTLADVTLVPCADLVGPKGPAQALRDKKADACCVITPDMIGLCGGLDKTAKDDAEGNVKGSHVVNSTATMSRSIVDAYWVRKDYFDAHKADVEKFVTTWLKAGESFVKGRDAYTENKKDFAEYKLYVSTMQNMQQFYGVEALPTIEVDVHGMIQDAELSRIPGNEVFFTEANNLVGFDAKLKASLDFALALGYTTKRSGWDKATWDYKKISENAGVKYVAPVIKQGRINAEAIDFKDIDDKVVLSFPIYFGVEQKDFNPDQYSAEFNRVSESAALFGNSVIVVKGHSDTLQALTNFFLAAKAKGLITGNAPNYKFDGKPLDLTNTATVINLIQSTSLAGYKDSKGRPIDDPRETVAAAQTLSQSRAETVKKALESYLGNKVRIDWSQIQPRGMGIAEPVYPRPRSEAEMGKNRRVEFAIIRVQAESVAPEFDFDK